jgi:hypothetical protein
MQELLLTAVKSILITRLGSIHITSLLHMTLVKTVVKLVHSSFQVIDITQVEPCSFIEYSTMFKMEKNSSFNSLTVKLIGRTTRVHTTLEQKVLMKVPLRLQLKKLMNQFPRFQKKKLNHSPKKKKLNHSPKKKKLNHSPKLNLKIHHMC